MDPGSALPSGKPLREVPTATMAGLPLEGYQQQILGATSAVPEKVEEYRNVKHSTTHPKFLHSNSTSHRWAFGAIAELIDNAMDPDANASQ